jgi:hypothetical protein
MTVITESPVVPARVRALVRHLGRRGPMGHDDLLHAFSPPTLGSERGGTEVRQILLEGQRLGIFDEQDGAWNLASPIADGEELLAVLERSIVSLGDGEGSGPSDPALAIAWFLTTDPYRPLDPSENWVTLVGADCPDESESAYGLTNPTRSGQFAHWATYLGFAWRLSGMLVPDPTAALERHLRLAIPAGESVRIRDALELLSHSSPVFEGGAVRGAVESALIPERERSPSRLSRSTSFALLRLKSRGVLELPPPPSDASVMALDTPGGGTNVSHLVISEAK